MKSSTLTATLFLCSLASLGAVEAVDEPTRKSGLYWLGLFIGGAAVLAGLIFTSLKIYDRFQQKRERWLEERLKAHCPASHETLRQALTQLQTSFGSEIGQLKNLIIEKSPNGRLDDLIKTVTEIQSQLEKME